MYDVLTADVPLKDVILKSELIQNLYIAPSTMELAGAEVEIINKENTISAMLLDLNMPNVNGFVVLEYFKQNDLFKKIPVSVITGLGNDDLIEQAMKYDIVDVLRKPFNERDLKLVVDKTINNL